MSNKTKEWDIPIVKCPVCSRPLLFSNNAEDKYKYAVFLVNNPFIVPYSICSKCKAKVQIKELVNDKKVS